MRHVVIGGLSSWVILGGIHGPLLRRPTSVGLSDQGPCASSPILHLGSDTGLDHKMKCYSHVVPGASSPQGGHVYVPRNPAYSLGAGRIYPQGLLGVPQGV